MELVRKTSKLLIDDGVAYIIFNRPEIKNALALETNDEILEYLDLCEKDDGVRVVVFRGAGGTFSSGADVSSLKEQAGAGDLYGPTKESCAMSVRIRRLPKPVIAWVEGAVAGAGMGIMLACDMAYADDNAKLIFAFVNMGLCPDTGCAKYATERIGVARATELFMTGRIVSGAEAAGMGLITGSAPAEALEEKVTKVIGRLKKGPTTAYGCMKQMMNQVVYSDLDGMCEVEGKLQQICGKTHDNLECVSAFLEKRKPICTGK